MVFYAQSTIAVISGGQRDRETETDNRDRQRHPAYTNILTVQNLIYTQL